MDLTFKKPVDFLVGNTYSVVLRGARKYLYKTVGADLEIWVEPTVRTFEAEIVSQKQLRFTDLEHYDTIDNCDKEVEDLGTLLLAMKKVYPDFDTREIITLLQFRIQ